MAMQALEQVQHGRAWLCTPPGQEQLLGHSRQIWDAPQEVTGSFSLLAGLGSVSMLRVHSALLPPGDRPGAQGTNCVLASNSLCDLAQINSI